MSLFRRSQLSGLQAEVTKLRELSDDLTRRLTSIETRPQPRPHPLTLEAFSRVEELSNDAARSAAIARADVVLRISNLDAVITDLSIRLAADQEALGARLDDVSRTLEYQGEYLETHADQLALSLQATGAGTAMTDTSNLQANQTRIANDLARLTIDLRDEVAKLAAIVKPGEMPRVRAYAVNGNGANGTGPADNGEATGETTGETNADVTATAVDDTIDLRR
jgi:predicted  nucleic acid-binding Zn-ribbon protein